MAHIFVQAIETKVGSYNNDIHIIFWLKTKDMI